MLSTSYKPKPVGHSMRNRLAREFALHRTAYFVLFLALVTAVLFWDFFRRHEQDHADMALAHEVEEARENLDRRLAQYADALYGLRGLFAVKGEVSRAEFKQYVDAMIVLDRLRGAQALQFVRRVAGADREAYEARVRAAGNPAGDAFTITPSGQRVDYYVNEYVEPYKGNERALGFDIASAPADRRIAEATRDDGVATGSGRLSLIQDSVSQPGFVIRLPIYQTDAPVASVAERRRALIGFVAVAFRVESLMQNVLAPSFFKDFDLTIHDTGIAGGPQAAVGEESQLFDSRKLKQAGGPLAQYANGASRADEAVTVPVDVAGLHWQLTFVPTVGRAVTDQMAYPALLSLGALLISGLLFWALRMQAVSRRRAEDIAHTLTEELRESEARYRVLAATAPVGIFRSDRAGRCLYVNQAWTEITGHPPEMAMGANWHALLHADERDDLLKKSIAAMQGRHMLREEYRVSRPDGSTAWVYLQASPDMDAAGDVVGLVGAITDITEQKRAEGELERTLTLFQAAMDSTTDGLLVTDMEGKLQSHNRQFLELLGITADIVESHDPSERTARIAARMRDPQAYLDHVQRTIDQGEAETQDVLELADGRALECFTRPQRLGGRQVGRVWSLRDVTAQVRSEAALRQELHFRSELMDVSPNPMYVKDLEGRYVSVNQAWERYYGRRYRWLGKALAEFEPQEAAERRPHELALLVSGGSAKYELRTVDIEGHPRDMIDNMSVYTDEAGKPTGIIGVLTDITERKQAEDRLRESEEKFRLITENVGDLVAMLDAEGRRLYNSPSYHRIFGASPLAEDPFIDIHPDDRERIKKLFKETVATGEGRMDQFRFIRPDGTVRFIESQGSVIRDETGKVSKVIVVSRDITERKQSEERVRHLAQHDVLTSLPNRVLLLDRIEQAIGRALRDHLNVAVLFIDLDRFKNINDSLGHHMGDQVLLAMAGRLTEALRETDTVARLGGDEFVVLLPNVDNPDNVGNVARKALEALGAPMTIAQHEMQVTGSIGIALYPQDGNDAEALMAKADTAMYHAKGSGRNNYQFFTAEMNAAVQRRLAVESGLRQALARNEFELAYQPQIDLRTGEIVAVEALVRWRHPRDGVIMPGEFIRVAEEIGLIIPLGEWVLRKACEQNRRWQLAGKPPVRIAVNLSARQFTQKNLGERIRLALADTGMEAKYLELEITESEMMEHASETVNSLHEIYATGVRVTIDDFGTGYSSLSYLKQLPIDRVKIDKSFVRDIHTDPDDAAIVAAIIAMGHVLKLSVVAEGVESESQLNFLRMQSCDEAQGYYIARPTTADEVGRMLGSPLPEAVIAPAIGVRNL